MAKQEPRTVWAVWTNTDLTEGPGQGIREGVLRAAKHRTQAGQEGLRDGLGLPRHRETPRVPGWHVVHTGSLRGSRHPLEHEHVGFLATHDRQVGQSAGLVPASHLSFSSGPC